MVDRDGLHLACARQGEAGFERVDDVEAFQGVKCTLAAKVLIPATPAHG